MNSTTTAQFVHFLSRLSGAHEVSLAVAKDTEEQATLIEALTHSTFIPLASILDYDKAQGATYLVMEDVNKNVYDFVCQYPLTVVTLTHPDTKELVTFHPRYNEPILLLTTDATLKAYEAQGLDILGRVGMVYRT